MKAQRPIIFSSASIRAILVGSKSQTRRVCKVYPGHAPKVAESPGVDWQGLDGSGKKWIARILGRTIDCAAYWAMCPYGVVGDRLWVRETWLACGDGRYDYRADTEDGPARWRPSIHMPRAASRITLEIVGVRLQRLQEVTEEDARAEGCESREANYWKWFDPKNKSVFDTLVPQPPGHEGFQLLNHTQLSYPARDQFSQLWEWINGKRAPWSTNPFVWALTFRVLCSIAPAPAE